MSIVLVVGLPFAIWLMGWMNEFTTTWVPLVAWVASLVTFPFRHWLDSDKLGENAGLSLAIKVPLQLLRLLGTIGFWLSLGVLASWAASGRLF